MNIILDEEELRNLIDLKIESLRTALSRSKPRAELIAIVERIDELVKLLPDVSTRVHLAPFE